MDGAVVSDAPPVSDGDADIVRIPEKTYTEEFYEAFPFYLSIGMTADEFWNQDCLLTKYYRKAFEMKKNRKNEELWLQGLYMYNALCSVSPLLHAFAKDGTTALPYLDKPIPLTQKEAEEREIAAQKERYEKMKSVMRKKANKNKQEV